MLKDVRTARRLYRKKGHKPQQKEKVNLMEFAQELDSRDRALDALAVKDFKEAVRIMQEETTWWKKIAIAKDILDASIEAGNFAKTRDLLQRYFGVFKNYGVDGVYAINMLYKRLAIAFLKRDFVEDAQRIVQSMYQSADKESLQMIITNIKQEKIGAAA